MQKIIEIFLPRLHNTVNQINDIVKIASKYGLHGVNLHPTYLDGLLSPDGYPNIYPFIDFPVGMNTTAVREIIIKTYDKQYGNIIKGFNIGPVLYNLEVDNWEKTEDDLEKIIDACHSVGKESRIFIDLIHLPQTQTVKTLIAKAEALEADHIILGTSKNKHISVDTMLSTALALQPETSVPIGVFGNINSYALVEGAEQAGFNPILLLPQNIFDIFSE